MFLGNCLPFLIFFVLIPNDLIPDSLTDVTRWRSISSVVKEEKQFSEIVEHAFSRTFWNPSKLLFELKLNCSASRTCQCTDVLAPKEIVASRRAWSVLQSNLASASTLNEEIQARKETNNDALMIFDK